MWQRRHLRLALTLALLVVAGLWSGYVGYWHLEGRETWLDRLEYPLLDLRLLLAGPRPAPLDLVIVAIDNEAIHVAGAFPLARETLARLVRAIGDAHPRAIGIDLLLLDRGQEESDSSLEVVLRETRPVLAAAATFTFGPGEVTPQGLSQASRVLRPLARFAEVSDLGLVNVAVDHNGTPRHLPLLIREPNGLLPAFALRVAASATGTEPLFAQDSIQIGPTLTRLDLNLNLPLRFYGPRGSVRTISAAALLKGEGTPATEILRDRIILIGSTVTGAADTFATPFDPLLPGIEVLATGVGQLLQGGSLIRDSHVRRLDAIAALGLAVASALLLALVPPSLAFGIIVAGAACWFIVTIAALTNEFWLSATIPYAALLPVLVFGLGVRLVVDWRETRQFADGERALSVFHSPDVAARISREPSFLLEPTIQEVGIVFVDLANFTAMSEQIGPQRTQIFLKSYHTLVAQIIDRHNGTVVSFMGDGVMCIFGLTEPDHNDAQNTLAAALSLVPDVQTWLQASQSDATLDVRVGAHYGVVVVSRLGSSAHQHITATGDSVNTTSRLLEVAKRLDMTLVVTQELLSSVGEIDCLAQDFQGLGNVEIRGRTQPLSIAWR